MINRFNSSILSTVLSDIRTTNIRVVNWVRCISKIIGKIILIIFTSERSFVYPCIRIVIGISANITYISLISIIHRFLLIFFSIRSFIPRTIISCNIICSILITSKNVCGRGYVSYAFEPLFVITFIITIINLIIVTGIRSGIRSNIRWCVIKDITTNKTCCSISLQVTIFGLNIISFISCLIIFVKSRNIHPFVRCTHIIRTFIWFYSISLVISKSGRLIWWVLFINIFIVRLVT